MNNNYLKAHILACLITAKLIRKSQSVGVVFENKHYGKYRQNYMQTSDYYTDLIKIAFDNALKARDESIFNNALRKTYLCLLRDEIKELTETRNVKTSIGLINVFKEQRTKFKSICKKCNEFLGEGGIEVEQFDKAVELLYKDFYTYYQKNL